MKGERRENEGRKKERTEDGHHRRHCGKYREGEKRREREEEGEGGRGWRRRKRKEEMLTPVEAVSGTGTIVAIVGSIIGVVFLLLALLFMVYWTKIRNQMNIKALPPDVRWFYEWYLKHPSQWTKEGTSS
jgi:hypothetical protein